MQATVVRARGAAPGAVTVAGTGEAVGPRRRGACPHRGRSAAGALSARSRRRRRFEEAAAEASVVVVVDRVGIGPQQTLRRGEEDVAAVRSRVEKVGADFGVA